MCYVILALHWRHIGGDDISNHQPHHYLLNLLFRRRSKKTSKLCVTGLCGRNSPGAGEFPAQMASNEEHISIWWRHHGNARGWRYQTVWLIASQIWYITHCIFFLLRTHIYCSPRVANTAINMWGQSGNKSVRIELNGNFTSAYSIYKYFRVEFSIP